MAPSAMSGHAHPHGPRAPPHGARDVFGPSRAELFQDPSPCSGNNQSLPCPTAAQWPSTNKGSGSSEPPAEQLNPSREENKSRLEFQEKICHRPEVLCRQVQTCVVRGSLCTMQSTVRTTLLGLPCGPWFPHRNTYFQSFRGANGKNQILF